VRCCLDDGHSASLRVSRLEDTGAHEDAFGAHLANQGGIGRGGNTAGYEGSNWQLAGFSYFAHQVVWCLEFLCSDEELVFIEAAQTVDITANSAQVTHCFGDIAGAGLTLGANHCGTFGDTTQRLTQVGSTTDERYVELPFVDVVGVVRWTKHLGFIDEIHAESFQYLRFNEVSDTGLGHHGDGNRVDDAFDQVRVAHARNATLCTDIGWHTLQSHDCGCAGCFSDAGL